MNVYELSEESERTICDGYQCESEDGSNRYGDYSPIRSTLYPPEAVWVFPTMLGGSDYSGGDVTLSNFRVFIKEHGEKANVREVYGGHGTYAIAIRGDVTDPDILQTLKALKDYPVIDEEHLSEVESELQEEAWSNWVRHDFERALSGICAEVEDEWVQPVVDEELSEDTLRTLFREACERANVYPINESSGMWYDMKRILESVTVEHVKHAVQRTS